MGYNDQHIEDLENERTGLEDHISKIEAALEELLADMIRDIAYAQKLYASSKNDHWLGVIGALKRPTKVLLEIDEMEV